MVARFGVALTADVFDNVICTAFKGLRYNTPTDSQRTAKSKFANGATYLLVFLLVLERAWALLRFLLFWMCVDRPCQVVYNVDLLCMNHLYVFIIT